MTVSVSDNDPEEERRRCGEGSPSAHHPNACSYLQGPFYGFRYSISNQGKPKIILDGYGFNQRKKETGFKYWICDQRRHLSCLCSATLDLGTNALMLKGEHNHKRNPKYVSLEGGAEDSGQKFDGQLLST